MLPIGIGVASLQEADALHNTVKSNPELHSAERFTPLRLPIDEIFNTFKYQPWARRPEANPIQSIIIKFGGVLLVSLL